MENPRSTQGKITKHNDTGAIVGVADSEAIGTRFVLRRRFGSVMVLGSPVASSGLLKPVHVGSTALLSGVQGTSMCGDEVFSDTEHRCRFSHLTAYG